MEKFLKVTFIIWFESWPQIFFSVTNPVAPVMPQMGPVHLANMLELPERYHIIQVTFYI